MIKRRKINTNLLKVFPKGLSLELNEIETALFFYKNGEVNWFVTDYLMSLDIMQGSRSLTRGYLSHFLEFLDADNDYLESATPLGLVNDKVLEQYVEYITDDIGLLNNPINKRVKSAIYLLNFIQDNYFLDYNLITKHKNNLKTSTYGDFVNVTIKENKYSKEEYLDHNCLPDTESYGIRSQITDEAIDAVWDALYELEDEAKNDNYYHKIYRIELLKNLVSILEQTGVRVSEASKIDNTAIEILRVQLERTTDTPMTLEEILSLTKSKNNPQAVKSIKSIYEKAINNAGNNSYIWLKIVTTKGKNKDKIRIIPIPESTAKYLVDFYDDYIIEEIDRKELGLPKVDRKRHNCLFVQPFTHKAMTGPMLSKLYYDTFKERITKYKISPHLYRHRFITKLVAYKLQTITARLGNWGLAKLILEQIKGLTGHVSVDTMLHYVELAELEITPSPTQNDESLEQDITQLLNKRGIEDDDLVRDIITRMREHK